MIEAVWDQGFKRSYRKRIHKNPHIKRQFSEKMAYFWKTRSILTLGRIS